MHRLNPIVVAIVAGVLALLLVIYVFAGGGWRDNPDQLSDAQISGAGQASPEARCASRETYNYIKSELFRQAADLSGGDAATFSKVAPQSFLRMASPKLTRHDERVGVIGCAASLTLTLPPGLMVDGGQRSLAGEVGYAIRPSPGGGQTVTLSADTIVVPLATLSRAEADPEEQVASVETDTDAQTRPIFDVQPPPQPEPDAIDSPPISRAPEPLPEVRVPAPPPEPRTTAPAPAPAVQRTDPPSTTATTIPTPAEPPATTSPIRAAPSATVRPSFNCRRARTRGEIAVCGDGRLASLDRQMSEQFNRAVSTADAGKRTQLQRSRDRFLRFRDSCGNTACVAGSYRERMQEIQDIMNERWSPR